MIKYNWIVEICESVSRKALFTQSYGSFDQISDRLSHLSGEMPFGYFIRVSQPPDATVDELEKLKALCPFEIAQRDEPPQ
jgi:hypothetical protein